MGKIKREKMTINKDLLAQYNEEFKDKSPSEIILWALSFANRPVVTTNFRPYEATILHAVTRLIRDIDVIWCDTGYNTPQTYRHAKSLIEQLNMQVHVYVPRLTAAYRDVLMGIPAVDDPMHQEFSHQVKLEPFQRAMQTHKPDVWFTNLRKGQTALRDELDIFSFSKDGVLKVSPFYYWTDTDLDGYLAEYDLPNEFKYFDPTKALENRECGIHQ